MSTRIIVTRLDRQSNTLTVYVYHGYWEGVYYEDTNTLYLFYSDLELRDTLFSTCLCVVGQVSSLGTGAYTVGIGYTHESTVLWVFSPWRNTVGQWSLSVLCLTSTFNRVGFSGYRMCSDSRVVHGRLSYMWEFRLRRFETFVSLRTHECLTFGGFRD